MRPVLLQGLLDRIHGAREISMKILPKKGIEINTHHRSEDERNTSLSSKLFVPSMELKTLVVNDDNGGGGGGGSGGLLSSVGSDDDDDRNSSSSSSSSSSSTSNASKYVLIFPMKDVKAFLGFCLAQQATSNNITALFKSIGTPMLLTTSTANAMLHQQQQEQHEQQQQRTGGGSQNYTHSSSGTFSAEMIIATVGLDEL